MSAWLSGEKGKTQIVQFCFDFLFEKRHSFKNVLRRGGGADNTILSHKQANWKNFHLHLFLEGIWVDDLFVGMVTYTR